MVSILFARVCARSFLIIDLEKSGEEEEEEEDVISNLAIKMKLHIYAGAIWMIKSSVDVANVGKKLNIHT